LRRSAGLRKGERRQRERQTEAENGFFHVDLRAGVPLTAR
jgi:hypothetical protein